MTDQLQALSHLTSSRISILKGIHGKETIEALYRPIMTPYLEGNIDNYNLKENEFKELLENINEKIDDYLESL